MSICAHACVCVWWWAGGGTIGGDFIAPFKTTHIDDTDGSLRLIYWKGNDVLKGAERKKKNAGKENAFCAPFL